MPAPTHVEAAAMLGRLRGEFAALYQKEYRQGPDSDLTNADFERAAELRGEISMLKAHVARLENFEAILARGRRS